MASQLLVPLRGSDRIEHLLPYIEKVLRPGLNVTFLIHYSHPAFHELIGQLLVIHTAITPSRLPGQFNDEIVQQHMLAAVQKVASAGLALRNKGVEVSVTVFAGSFRKIVREYAARGDVHLVLMPHSRAEWLPRPLRKLVSRFHFLKPQTLAPVLLLHPSSTVGRFP
jgi:hypothetical protein